MARETVQVDIVTNTQKSTRSLAKYAAAVGGAAVAVRGLIKFAKESVKAASDQEEIYSKFTTVFRDQADEIENWADTFSDAVGRNTTDTLAFLSTIQDTLVPLGFARDAAADMSTQVVELATDLASFNNLPTEQVVRDIQSAIVGNTETLRKYGVVASQAAIEQEALTSGIWDGEGAITAQEKAAAILNLTLAGTEDAQGDALRTADSFANSQRRLQAEVQQLKEDFGAQLMEGIKPLMQGVTELIGGYNDLREATEDFREAVKVAEEDRTAQQQLEVLREQRQQILRNIEAAESGEDAYARSLGFQVDSTEELRAQLTELNRQIERQRILAEFDQQATEGAEAQTEAAETLTDLEEKRARAAERTDKAFGGVTSSMDKMDELVSNLAPETNTLTEYLYQQEQAWMHVAQAEEEAAQKAAEVLASQQALAAQILGPQVEAFNVLGQAIVGSSANWSDYAKASIEAIATVLEAQAKAWFLQAAGFFFVNPAKAGGLLAAAVGAQVGAGIVRGFASKVGEGFQFGGDFTVPPGYENDTFPMRVNSGERVTVTPKSETQATFRGGGGGGLVLSGTFNIYGAGGKEAFIRDVYESMQRGQKTGALAGGL